MSCLLCSLQAKAFYAWVDTVQWRKRMRLVGNRAAQRMLNKTIALAFYSWLQWLDDKKMGRQLNTKEELAVSTEHV